MRSELVMGALEQVPNPFLLTRLVAKAIRALHWPNTRVADTANDVLRRYSAKSSIVIQPLSSPSSRPELRQAS